MFVKYATSDNAFGKLGSAVNTTQTTITLSSSQNLPTGTAVWIATLTQYAIDGTVGKFEKVKVTNNVSGTLTIVRGFDGTVAETFNQDDYVFLNVVSEIIKDIQDAVDAMSGVFVGSGNNKVFGTDGSGNIVALTQGSAFNKAFGTTAGTVAEGNHTHSQYQLISQKNTANGYAGLDSNGQIDPGQIPVLATTETIVVVDQTAMLALTSAQVQKGDVAVQSGGSNIGTRWMFGGGTISDINNWILLSDITPEWSVIANKPTTVSGYGITDAVTIGGVQTITGAKTFSNGVITIYTASQTAFGGISTEVGSDIFNFGGNEDGTNRFGGSYNSTKQGGMIRVDTRPGNGIFQFLGRAAGSTGPVSTVLAMGIDTMVMFGSGSFTKNDSVPVLSLTSTGGGAAEDGVLFLKAGASGGNDLARYLVRGQNSTGTDVFYIGNVGNFVTYRNGEAIKLAGGASQTWVGFYNGTTREGYIGTYAAGVGLVVNCDVGPLIFGSSPTYNIGGFDFNGGRIKKPYQTATGGGGGNLIIGSRYEISNIQHSAQGHIVQVLWGDSGSTPEGSGNDGGWGLEFGPHGSPYLKMIGNDVQIGKSGWTVTGLGVATFDYLKHGYAIDVTGTDLNNLIIGGFYNGSSCTNAPNGNWWYIQVYRHSNITTDGYIMQVTTSLTSSPPEQYIRIKNNGSWSSWVKTTP